MFLEQIKLGEPGWKERYYKEKFQAMTEEQREKVKRNMVSHSLTS